MKLVAYVRVSEETENPENQKFAIYELAARRGYRVERIYEDIGISGALAPRERPGFSKALEALSGADGLVVYALDRIARSLEELVDVVREIESKGKVVLSVKEEWLQQLDPKIRGLIVAILGWAAEMEREFISMRTKEALKRIKAMGGHIGRRPVMNDAIAKRAIEYVAKGYAMKDIAKILSVSYGTLMNYILKNPAMRGMYYEARAKAKARRAPARKKQASPQGR